MLVEELKALSAVQGTVNPLIEKQREKQREVDRREIVRFNGVIDQMKVSVSSSIADAEEIERLNQLLQETKHAAAVAVAGAATTPARSTAGAGVGVGVGAGAVGEGNRLSGVGGEREGGSGMALLLAERKAEADKREIERLSMMLDETLALLNESNQERAVAEEHIVELRGKVDSVRDIVINESTVRATEAQLTVVNRQLKEVTHNHDHYIITHNHDHYHNLSLRTIL